MNKKLSNLLRSSLLVGTLGLSFSLVADPFVDSEDTVSYRQDALQLIRANFGPMAGMIRGEIPYNAADFQTRASALKHLVHIPWDGFVGAGEGVTTNSDALPAIWENWEDFEDKSNALIEAAAELAVVAESGDLDQIRPKFMATAQTCRQCHDDYRAD